MMGDKRMVYFAVAEGLEEGNLGLRKKQYKLRLPTIQKLAKK